MAEGSENVEWHDCTDCNGDIHDCNYDIHD